jgi:hypothetical protein
VTKTNFTPIGSSTAANEPWFDDLGKLDAFLVWTRNEDDAEDYASTIWGQLRRSTAHRIEQEREMTVSMTLRHKHWQPLKKHSAIDLLRSWREGDEKEQRATLDYLMKAIDENRLRGAKVFEKS